MCIAEAATICALPRLQPKRPQAAILCPPGERLRAALHAARTEGPRQVGTAPSSWRSGCNPHTQAATRRRPGCKPVRPRLQPDGAQAATLYKLGCNPTVPRWNAPALTVSILAHFDVVGLTEMLDESLLLLADKAGLQHLGYSTLAANNKPEHPAKAKALLKVRVRVRVRVS